MVRTNKFCSYQVIIFLLFVGRLLLAKRGKLAKVEVDVQVPKRSSTFFKIGRHGCSKCGPNYATQRSIKSARSRECVIRKVWGIELMLCATLYSQGIIVWSSLWSSTCNTNIGFVALSKIVHKPPH